MKTGRIFIFGSTGMLGWITSHYLSFVNKKIISLDRKEFDVLYDSIDDFNSKYKVGKDDVLINAIGITNRHTDKLTDEIFYKVNTHFPKSLDILAGKTGSKFIHVTTDCVYKGDMGGYWESLPGNCDDVYGLSKLGGESLNNAVIIRTSFIGIEQNHRYNLISWVISQNEKTINGFTNHTWNGITTLQFAKIINHFLENGFPKPGLYHIFSKNIVTKYELLAMIIKIFELDIKLNLHQTDKPVLRHLFSEKKLCESLLVPSIEEQLLEFRDYCNSHKIIWKYI